MFLKTSTDAAADLDAVWTAMTDVTSWPRWTKSVTQVRRLDDGPLRMGSQARVKQPGLQPLIWTVTELSGVGKQPGQTDQMGQTGQTEPADRKERAADAERAEFTWVTHSPGVQTVGRHRLARTGDGATRITLELEQTGPLAGLVNLLLGKRTERYLHLEAAGRKAAGEDVAAHR